MSEGLLCSFQCYTMAVTGDSTDEKLKEQSPCMAAPPGGVFVQNLNPLTGKQEWKMQAEDYDYQQEVARAGFADMLHDYERVRESLTVSA